MVKKHGDQKIGIVGASTTGTLALTAASYFEDLTLTIGLTPSDFIWQGFMQAKKDGCKEWPIEGESLFSYKGEPLPYMPFCYKHPDYWHVIDEETKRTGDMLNSRKLFDDSETTHPITEEEIIKIEKIHGTLLLIGAEDDVLWDTAKIYPPYGAAYERTSTYVQVGVCYLRACDPFRFSGEYVKDIASNWFWNLYETGISSGKKISERMPESTSGY